MTYILMVEGVEMVMVPEDGVAEGVGVDGMIQTDMVMVGYLINEQKLLFFYNLCVNLETLNHFLPVATFVFC